MDCGLHVASLVTTLTRRDWKLRRRASGYQFFEDSQTRMVRQFGFGCFPLLCSLGYAKVFKWGLANSCTTVFPLIDCAPINLNGAFYEENVHVVSPIGSLGLGSLGLHALSSGR